MPATKRAGATLSAFGWPARQIPSHPLIEDMLGDRLSPGLEFLHCPALIIPAATLLAGATGGGLVSGMRARHDLWGGRECLLFGILTDCLLAYISRQVGHFYRSVSGV